MEQGISQTELAGRVGVNEMTIVNWEKKGMVPRVGKVRESIAREIEEVERFLNLGE